ncbi:hypothetical protein ACFS5N_09960 [Mucilaginibacter ximonensis]|uniref:DUF4174 domain-containing protein n=1 Tax=Mucilaginibacter ximonensis TaxID=538021 RepID=A0ABW5YBU9_9SPHI
MKNILLIFILAIGCSSNCCAQQFETIKRPTFEKQKPLVLIKLPDPGHKEIPFEQATRVLADSDIAEINVIKGEQALKYYGEKGSKGVIILAIMKTTNTFNTHALLDKFHVAKKNQRLPVKLDNITLDNPYDLYFSASKIKSIWVMNDKHGKPQFISINTKTPPVKRQADKVFDQFQLTDYRFDRMMK